MRASGRVFCSHMAVQSPSTQIGHLKVSSELPEHSVAGGACCPLSLPTTGCADQHATKLLIPIRPRTCGTPRKGHLQSSWNMWSLGFVQKGAISRTFQSHVECRKTIAVLRQPAGRERRGCTQALVTLLLPSTPSSRNISRTR